MLRPRRTRAAMEDWAAAADEAFVVVAGAAMGAAVVVSTAEAREARQARAMRSVARARTEERGWGMDWGNTRGMWGC
jgi:hypothetical protein